MQPCNLCSAKFNSKALFSVLFSIFLTYLYFVTRRGVAPYWGPGDPVPGAHFQGEGEVQPLLPVKLHCVYLYKILKCKGENKLSIRDLTIDMDLTNLTAI